MAKAVESKSSPLGHTCRLQLIHKYPSRHPHRRRINPLQKTREWKNATNKPATCSAPTNPNNSSALKVSVMPLPPSSDNLTQSKQNATTKKRPNKNNSSGSYPPNASSPDIRCGRHCCYVVVIVSAAVLSNSNSVCCVQINSGVFC